MNIANGPKACWDIWYGCDYRCSYCWWQQQGAWERLAETHRDLPAAAWVRAWDRLAERHGAFQLDILGGEPLRHPEALALFEGLTRRHTLLVTTNLSVSKERLERLADRVSPERLRLAASYHPEFSKLDEFVEKLSFIKERGFDAYALVVAWPPSIPRFKDWRSRFADAGIAMEVAVFQGPFEGRTYPEAYGPEQRAIVREAMPNAAQVRYRLERTSTRSRLCGSGSAYITVKADGSAFRCSQAGADAPLGNILDADFRMRAEPSPCPYETCNCSEHEFLVE